MNTAAKLAEALSANEPRMDDWIARSSEVGRKIPGWSRHLHYLFFKSWLDAFPEGKSVLMLGVYMGRDISFLLDACPGRRLQVVGVDKFADTPCADWPEDKRGMSWTTAGFGEPPNAKTALDNIAPRDEHAVRLIEADDAVWLEQVQGAFDLIYIDTSHDKDTVARQIRQVHKLCHPETIVAGDDYNNGPDSWGVKQAVTEGFKRHHALGEVIWFAGANDFL